MEIDKAHLRHRMMQVRNNLLEAEIINKSKNIFENLISLDIYRKSDIIYSYGSIRSEVATWKFIQHVLSSHKRAALPRVIGPHTMEFYEIQNFEELEPGYMGILEPSSKCRRIIVEENPGLIVVPGLAFDRNFTRLGYGGGFYDRFLQKYDDELVSCGVAYDIQLIHSVIKESTDHSLDWIITESEILERTEKYDT